MWRLGMVVLYGCLLIPEKADTGLSPIDGAPQDSESGVPDSMADDSGTTAHTGESGCPGGSEEVPYDDIDNDCDEETPDDDLDGDGYEEDEDCDDQNGTVFPGAEEQCEDGWVNDCEGDGASAFSSCLGGDTVNLEDADLKLEGVSAGDYAGFSLSDAGDIDGDSLGDVVIGAPFEDSGGTGSAYLLLGGGVLSSASGELSLSEADVALPADPSEEYAGCSVSEAGDVDGDGLGDLLIGASLDARGGADAGAAYLLLGGSSLEGASSRLELRGADFKFIGVMGSRTGVSVSNAGDVDGDELDDLIIGAYLSSDGASEVGSAFVYLGADLPEGGSGELDLSLGAMELMGEDEDDLAGWAVSDAGDVDGDGLGDVMVGAFAHGESLTKAGAAYVLQGGGVLGTASDTLSLGDADLELNGEDTEDRAGISVSGAGDVDGDGLSDVLVGAYFEDGGGGESGATYLLSGGGALALALAAGTANLSEADIELSGEASDDMAGWSVSDAGDVDADGLGDLIIGAKGGGSTGSAFLLLGGGTLAGFSGQMSLSEADLELVGEAVGDGAGYAVSGAGDVDGDGFDELLVGAWLNDGGADSSGSAYLVMGGGY